MPSFQPSMLDILLVVASLYTMAQVLIAWESFSGCDKPVQVWPLVACPCLILFRAAHILFKTDEGLSVPWLCSFFNHKHKVLSLVMGYLLYPLFLVWVLVGTSWYSETNDLEECFNDPQQKVYYMAWIVISYIWIVVYNIGIITSGIKHSNEHTVDPYYVNLDQYNDGGEDQWDGLSEANIEEFKVVKVTALMAGEHLCSVCQEDIKLFEKARELRCGHLFHLGCIDNWLHNHSRCPNCKLNLRSQNNNVRPLLTP